MSYLKKRPGTRRSLTSLLCSVTAYWFVKMVRSAGAEPEPRCTLYTVGTTDMKYWNLWKFAVAKLIVRSSGLTREG